VTHITTGSADLDHVLGGGLPVGSLVILAGAPGTGKTILAQQICFANAVGDKTAVYYTTWSEPHDKLVRHLEPFSFFEKDALGWRIEFVHLPGLLDGLGGGGFEAASDEILRKSFHSKPAVIVVDSSKALHDVVDPAELRRTLYDLASKVAHSNAVLILVGEYSLEETRMNPEFAVADGIVLLENEARGPVDRRWLRVLKMRGGETAPGQHSFAIGPDGFEVFPRLETTLPKRTTIPEGRAEFGIPGIDGLLGGGIPRGDSALALGPSGVGKTMLALHFTKAGLDQGERSLHISFQEGQAQLLERAKSAGWDWAPLLGDRLTIAHVPPVEVDLDRVGSIVRAELARGDVGRVVVDSLAELAFAARETERLPGYIWALTGFARAAGATTLLTNEIASLGETEVSNLSFLFDDVILLRYVERESGLIRGANVLKMRRSGHDRRLVGFEVGSNGIEAGEELEGVTGLLGWSALRTEID
jgi:circadian clock protein KaiC